MSSHRFLSTLLLALWVFPAALRAQTNEGRIVGTVRDATGGVVVGAAVTVTNTATTVSATRETNSAGEYSSGPLEPGRYTVTAQAKGFKKAESREILLEVGREIRVDLDLVTGSVRETVEVKAEATMTDTTDNTLNGVLSNRAVTDLPVQGRDFLNLLELHPGVQRTPGGGFHSVTSNGNRPDDNNYFIDGANDNDVYYGETVLNEAGISGTPASHLPLDAIQEFNTQESPDADYGVKPGVVANIGLKSGTDNIHGSAYYFGRNSALDARNWFAPPPDPVPSLIFHDFGGSIGGPIKKGKWFYFVNYEGIRDKVGNPGTVDSPVTQSLVPVADMLPEDTVPADFSLVDAFALCNPNCSPTSIALKKLFPDNPGFTASSEDPALINLDFNNTNREDNIIAKTDFIVNSHHTLSARYIYGNSREVEEDASPLAPEFLSTTSPITQVFGANWAWTPNPRWVNELRVSYNSFNESIAPVDHTVDPVDYGINTGITDPRLFGLPRINPGDSFFNYLGGNSSWPLQTAPSATFDISDTVSVSHGRHSIRFGGDFRRGHVNYFRATYGRGRVDFADLEGFAAGDTTDVDEWRLLYGDPARDVSLKSFGLFMQDGFRLNSRFTINAGLRYDVTYPIKDSHNMLANFVPTEGIVQVGRGISQPYDTNYNNVSPRLGFAWDVFGTGKTVLRAGGGIIFEQPSIRTFMFNGGGLNLNPTAASLGVTPGNGNITSFLVESFDGTQLNWDPGPVFPNASVQGCGPDLPCDIFAVNQHLKTPYVANWNVNVQQALTPDALLQVAYVANRGIKLYSVTDPNQADPTASAACILETSGETGVDAIFDGDYAGCEQTNRPFTTNCGVNSGPCFPYIGFMQFLANHSNSSYNALQVSLTKRFSHGLYVLAGYTWGHAIDTATNNVAQSAGTAQNSNDYADERGNGDFDIRHRFTVSAFYELPSREAPLQMLKGWQLGTILVLQTGEPFTYGDFFDDVSATGELEDRWNITGPKKNISWSKLHELNFVNDFVTDANGHVIDGNQQCIAAAGPNQLALDMLGAYGCYVEGNTVLTPPALGTFGNMGRNWWRGPNYKNWDFSVSKVWGLGDRVRMQFRAEFFNIINHPNFGGFSLTTDLADQVGVGLANFTPDVEASNPVMGSGGSRHIQLGLKFLW
ncbi:MAG TPA: TonB-dependent receptor [Candidatus Sulfotelmatobacter sp.]|nr:TonB-dependent receptor [Candidatus Sulfotelmatobacter sp.]